MSVYSSYNIAAQQGLSVSEVRGSGHVEINHPDDEVSYQPSSVDLTLGEVFLRQKRQREAINVADEDSYPEYEQTTASEIVLDPQDFVLATTRETVHLDDEIVGLLWGRSSVGRLGLFVHNAGLVDAGYDGQLTLELWNASPNRIRLQSDMRIVQMTLHELKQPATTAYDAKKDAKYDGQKGTTPSRLWEDFQ